MKKRFTSLCGTFASLLLFALSFAGAPLHGAYKVDTARLDGAAEFNAFLERCSARERVQLLQCLRAFDCTIDDRIFGKVKGLLPLENYATDPQNIREQAQKGLMLRPETWNDVSADTVLDAIEKGYITLDYSQQAIRNALTWLRYSKLNHAWRSTQEIDYHRDILRWVASKKDVDDDLIEKHSTFDLERAVAKKFFQQIWDRLSAAQREQLNRDLEQYMGIAIDDKGALMIMDGANAVKVLDKTIAFSDRAFNGTMAIIAGTTAKAFNIAVPLAAIGGVSSAVPALAVPVGWALSAVAITVDSFLVLSNDDDYIAAFVIQANLIKTNWLIAERAKQSPQQQKK